MSITDQLKIAVITGSRADYGLLKEIIRLISKDDQLQLQLLVTGSHLSDQYGNTANNILDDGFNITKNIELPLHSDSAVGISNSVATAINGFANAFGELAPDIILLLGDRYEIFSAAQAAMFALIPVAHIAGGDTTEGAIDECMRHSITKMSHLHFVTNSQSAQRVIQLGENPERVYNVGSPGIDSLLATKLLSRAELETSLNFTFSQKNILVTFHPETISNLEPEKQCEPLLNVLDKLPDIGVIFTASNADSGGNKINKQIQAYVQDHPNSLFVHSLGQQRYYSTIKKVDAVVGNSSSGLYEVSSFEKATLNIGDRQKGRMQADSVINSDLTEESIRAGIDKVLSIDVSGVINPFGDGNSSQRIVKIIKETMHSLIDDNNTSNLLKKHFYDTEQY